MNEFALAIMYVATLAFASWLTWLWLQYRDLDKGLKQELLKLRQDVNALQMAQGLKQRNMPPWGPPPIG